MFDLIVFIVVREVILREILITNSRHVRRWWNESVGGGEDEIHINLYLTSSRG